MAELVLIRHAQASFGAANYDVLSERGHRQSRALGLALKALGTRPDALFIGSQQRHRETLEGILENLPLDTSMQPTVLPGLNEFDSHVLLRSRFGPDLPEDLRSDRRKHFSTLRDTVHMWQRDELTENLEETYQEFRGRVLGAVRTIEASGAKCALTVSSGGPIGMVVCDVMEAPYPKQMELQLQGKNCGVSRIVLAGNGRRFLTTFNETPHITAENVADYLTYS